MRRARYFILGLCLGAAATVFEFNQLTDEYLAQAQNTVTLCVDALERADRAITALDSIVVFDILNRLPEPRTQ